MSNESAGVPDRGSIDAKQMAVDQVEYADALFTKLLDELGESPEAFKAARMCGRTISVNLQEVLSEAMPLLYAIGPLDLDSEDPKDKTILTMMQLTAALTGMCKAIERHPGVQALKSVKKRPSDQEES